MQCVWSNLGQTLNSHRQMNILPSWVIYRVFWEKDIFIYNIFATSDIQSFFICPFEKWCYYAMAMSVHPSVRLSVHPSEFSGLFSTHFEISILNLVYTFSGWHDMLSLSFITIRSLWIIINHTPFCLYSWIVYQESHDVFIDWCLSWHHVEVAHLYPF